jgi:uncharacterized protein (UPF0303 family)
MDKDINKTNQNVSFTISLDEPSDFNKSTASSSLQDAFKQYRKDKLVSLFFLSHFYIECSMC